MPFFDQDGVHEIYRQLAAILDEYPGERIAVAEAWTPTIERTAHYVRPDELHQAFNFQYLSTAWDAAELREVIDRIAGRDAPGRRARHLGAVQPRRHPARHPLRQPARPRHPDPHAPGDRELGLRRARAATLLMLALPGSAYLYQGEELGLPDVADLPDEVRQDPAFFRGAGQDGFRDGCRVPIPWTREGSSYGFGGGRQLAAAAGELGELSVEAQTGDPGSTLELYRSAARRAPRAARPGRGRRGGVAATPPRASSPSAAGSSCASRTRRGSR